MRTISDRAKEKEGPTISFLVEIYSYDNEKLKKVKKFLEKLKLKFDTTVLKNY